MAYPLLRETVPASAHWAYRNLRGQHHVIHSVIHRKQGVGLGVSMCFRTCVPVSAADLAILRDSRRLAATEAYLFLRE